MLFVAPQAVNDGSLAGSIRGTSVHQQLYSAVSAASSWLDAAENQLLSGPVLLSEDTETQLTNFEVDAAVILHKQYHAPSINTDKRHHLFGFSV